jgi:hypothetical protein
MGQDLDFLGVLAQERLGAEVFDRNWLKRAENTQNASVTRLRVNNWGQPFVSVALTMAVQGISE